jgi:hypothetical protein
MPIQYRVMPPIDTARQTVQVNGRSYSATPGQVLDVPDFDGRLLTANGWSFLFPSGATSARPSPRAGVTAPYLAAPGFEFFDTTINKLIVFDGATWRDPASGSAV